MTLSNRLRTELEELVHRDRVVLFMKGTRRAPQCGYSATVVGILDEFLSTYTTVDVLPNPELREGIKEFSTWPTLPQLYIDGSFVGGADIVREMRDTGVLEGALGVACHPAPPPRITLTETAARALLRAAATERDQLHMEIDVHFEHTLYFGPPRPGELSVTTGDVTFRLDRASARRADGLAIDLVDGPEGIGFQIDNPNEPPHVKRISITDLKAMLDRGRNIEVFDMRDNVGPHDLLLPKAVPFNLAARRRLEDLPRDTPIAFFCHHGSTSRWTAEYYVEQGFRAVFNIEGGIQALADALGLPSDDEA